MKTTPSVHAPFEFINLAFLDPQPVEVNETNELLQSIINLIKASTDPADIKDWRDAINSMIDLKIHEVSQGIVD
jgi:hypothetical protein